MPQGSHLGPLLFLLFINDVVEVFKYCKCLLFADDLKMFMIVKDADDVRRLQSDLDGLSTWCKRNKLPLNFYKRSTMSFHRKRCPIYGNYLVDGIELSRNRSINDIGVTFD